MIEAMERFCRAAASFSARCVLSARLMVGRGMIGAPMRGRLLSHLRTIAPTHQINHLHRRRARFDHSPDILHGGVLNRGPYPIATDVPSPVSRQRNLPVMLVQCDWMQEKHALTLQSCNSRRCGNMDAPRVAPVECVTVNPREGDCVSQVGVVFSP